MNAKHMLIVATLLAGLLAASAHPPELINYQGRLLDGTNLVNGMVGLSLRFYDAPALGSLLYEDSNSVAVADGLYTTFIGDHTSAGALVTALASTSLYLEVAVNGQALTPRERVGSVAFALRAADSAALGGSPASSYATTSGVAAADQSLQLQIITHSLALATLDNTKVNRSGDTMTGPLVVNDSASGALRIDTTNSRVAIGAGITNVQEGTALLRGSLYLEGASGVFLRPGVGSGSWQSIQHGLATGTPVYVESDPIWTNAAAQHLRRDGSAAMTGNLDMGGHSITNVAVTSIEFVDGTSVGAGDVGNWEAAYAWGDHSEAGYATGTPNYAESDPLALLADGTRAMGGNLNLGGQSITNVAGMSLGGVYRTAWPTSALPLRSYHEYGAFSNAPVATGVDSIAQGCGARAAGQYSVVGGGISNYASGVSSVISGGADNGIKQGGSWSMIGGGAGNAIQAAGWSVICGGLLNSNQDAQLSVIGGGEQNRTTFGNFNAIVGGQSNSIDGAWYGVIGGGSGNRILAMPYYDACATIAGGQGNTIGTNSNHATISGGIGNSIESGSMHTSIGGGDGNTIKTNCSMAGICGGLENVIGPNSGSCAIGGGDRNKVQTNSALASIAGGNANVVQSDSQGVMIGGGEFNSAKGNHACVLGGYLNSATGATAVVLGGENNLAGAAHALAAGYRAKATNEGCFVWADFQSTNFRSVSNNEFAVRCTGGARFVTAVNAGGNPIAGVQLATGGGSWTSLSDRNAKEQIQAVEPREVLAKLAGVPVSTWKYKTQDEGIRHIGPMAQDFHEAFGVGENPTGITTVDADGVALAAIQGLYELVQQQQARIEVLELELGARRLVR